MENERSHGPHLRLSENVIRQYLPCVCREVAGTAQVYDCSDLLPGTREFQMSDAMKSGGAHEVILDLQLAEQHSPQSFANIVYPRQSIAARKYRIPEHEESEVLLRNVGILLAENDAAGFDGGEPSKLHGRL